MHKIIELHLQYVCTERDEKMRGLEEEAEKAEVLNLSPLGPLTGRGKNRKEAATLRWTKLFLRR